MVTYKKQIDSITDELCGIIKDNKYYIPLSADNTDYQEYLEWVAEGNTPEEAD